MFSAYGADLTFGNVPESADRSICGYEIRLGLSARDLGHAELRWALSAYRSKQFAVVADEQQHVLHVLLRDDCSAGDILAAYHHAVLSALTASGKVVAAVLLLFSFQASTVSMSVSTHPGSSRFSPLYLLVIIIFTFRITCNEYWTRQKSFSYCFQRNSKTTVPFSFHFGCLKVYPS